MNYRPLDPEEIFIDSNLFLNTSNIPCLKEIEMRFHGSTQWIVGANAIVSGKFQIEYRTTLTREELKRKRLAYALKQMGADT